MDLLDWLFPSTRKSLSPPPAEAMVQINGRRSSTDQPTFALVAHAFDPDGPDGDLMWLGLILQDHTGARYGYDDDRLDDLGLHIFRVAGVSKQKRELQDPAFAPAKFISLVKEDYHPYDTNTVSVWDRNRRVMAGYVPKEKARAIRQTMTDYPNSRALVMAHCLRKKTRVGLTVLFGPLDGLA